jgi:ADP-heptose:LPS heptosyltransferase
MYVGNPDVAQVWSIHRHMPFLLDAPWRAVRRALRDSAPGPVYVCERHYRQLPRIRRMLRLSGIDPRRCVFISDEPEDRTVHLIDRLEQFGTRTPAAIAAADYPPPATAAVDGPRLHIIDSERAARDSWLRAQGWAGRELVLIQPGNHRSMGPRRDRWRRLDTDDKWWPIERWAQLLQRMHAQRPAAMLEEIRSVAGLKDVAVVGTTLRQLFALYESAQSMVSVDTGPAHAAAALSLPLVVLYGAENPAYWLPRSPSGSKVIGVGGPPVATRADQVSVDTVFEAWRKVLGYADAVPAPQR